MLIEYYHPVPLPSIDDAKAPQVTPEVSMHVAAMGSKQAPIYTCRSFICTRGLLKCSQSMAKVGWGQMGSARS